MELCVLRKAQETQVTAEASRAEVEGDEQGQQVQSRVQELEARVEQLLDLSAAAEVEHEKALAALQCKLDEANQALKAKCEEVVQLAESTGNEASQQRLKQLQRQIENLEYQLRQTAIESDELVNVLECEKMVLKQQLVQSQARPTSELDASKSDDEIQQLLLDERKLRQEAEEKRQQVCASETGLRLTDATAGACAEGRSSNRRIPI